MWIAPAEFVACGEMVVVRAGRDASGTRVGVECGFDFCIGWAGGAEALWAGIVSWWGGAANSF